MLRGLSPTGLTQVATVTQLSYSDKTVSAGTEYYYAVVAGDSGGNLSPMSAETPVTVPVPPSAPTGLIETPTSDTGVSLTWAPAAGGGLPVTYYLVFRGTSPGALSQLATVAQNCARDATLTSGTTYYYAVQAKDSGGDVSGMSTAVAVTAPVPPSVPAGLTATTVTATAASLSWNASASGGLPVLYYAIFRGTSPGLLTPAVTVTQTSWRDTSLSPGTTYYYAVQAKDSGGDVSQESPVLTVTAYQLPASPRM